MEKVTSFFKGDQIAADVWRDKYQLKDKDRQPLEDSPDDMHKRMATEFGRIEFGYIMQEMKGANDNAHGNLSEFGHQLFRKRIQQSLEDIIQEIFLYFKDFSQIVPQGSIMSNLGNPFVFGSLSNCFGIDPPEDSYSGIMRADEELAQLMKRRGGVGTHLNNLRPMSASVTNAAATSSGVSSFAERYSNTTREVAQGGRRGALMLLLSCKHPEIFKFVTMKDDKTKVTGANVSVMLTDKFMVAAMNNEDFICTFPINKVKAPQALIDDIDYNQLHTIANQSNGRHEYIMKIHAKELFDLIVDMAHKNAEPGVAFIDTIKDYSPDGVYTIYEPELCNPCGEQWFHANDTCRLIAQNFFGMVTNPFKEDADIDLQKVYEVAYMQQRLGDDLVDLELEHIERILNKLDKDPGTEELKSREHNLWLKIYNISKGGRRTGGGFTALADMLAAINVKYTEAENVVEMVMHTKMKAELDAVIDMAILRGTFKHCNPEAEFGERMSYPANSFYEMIMEEFPEQAKRMYKYGRRNVSWSTVAPTGTVSLMTQTSSGLEPLFKAFYIRRRKINPDSKNVRVDFIDDSGDKWQEYPVLHPKFKDWIEINYPSTDINNKRELVTAFAKSPWQGCEADDIDWQVRIKINAIIQKYTSNAISCTINLPKDVDKSVVANIYTEGWKSGLKGITVYRDTSRSGVLVTKKTEIPTDEFGYADAPKRPVELEADYYCVISKGKKYAIVVGNFKNNPYELFAFENPLCDREYLKGAIIKVKKDTYKFISSHLTIDNLQLSSEHTDEKLLTRFVSGMLRHGMNPKYIIGQIDKCELNISSFGKAVSRVLSKYIPQESIKEKCPQCNEETLIRQEGCTKCISCSYSKC